MLTLRRTKLLSTFLLLLGFTAYGQNTPVVVQAESGTLGADWSSKTQNDVTYVTTTTNGGGQNPMTAARVISYSVTFPAAGSYNLYARIRVGSGNFNDDSFYYGNGFGTKTVTDDEAWIIANGLSPVGFTTATDVVTGAGTAQNTVWKWLNLSQFNGGEAPISFTVTADALTQTFQIGAREDGLDIDKFVFGEAGRYFTVGNLDNGQQGSTTPPAPPVVYTPTGQPIAQGKSKYLGSAYSTAQSPFFDVYWNAVTPENGGKWGSVEGTRGTYNWGDLDAAYKEATDNNAIFRLHTLIWGAQQPTWIYSLPAAEQLTAIKAWFAAVAARYPKIDFIDVVNEPINTPPTGFVTIGSTANPTGSVSPDGGHYIDALGGTGTTGYDWIITSFQLARQYFPTAKLMLNEYSLVNSADRTQKYVTIINLLKARNLIDGIGIQGHAFSTRNVPTTTINANLATLAATGIPIYVTELDIDGNNTAGQLDDDVQLTEYQRVFPLFWENPAVKGVTLWGYRPGHWRTTQGAYLANADNTERKALVWLRTYVQNTVLGTKNRDAELLASNLYPNPVSNGHFVISGAKKINSVEVFDLTGKQVQKLTNLHQTTVDVPLSVAPGLYLVQLASDQGTMTKKLVVK